MSYASELQLRLKLTTLTILYFDLLPRLEEWFADHWGEFEFDTDELEHTEIKATLEALGFVVRESTETLYRGERYEKQCSYLHISLPS